MCPTWPGQEQREESEEADPARTGLPSLSSLQETPGDLPVAKNKNKKKKEPNRRASGKTERSPVSHTERGLAKTEIIRVFSKSQAVGQAAEGRAREAGGCQGGRRSWRHLARLT